jgi:hypothetical protein
MTTSKKFTLVSTFAMLLSLAVLTLPDAASAYSAAGDFSTAANPNGVWSYGWSYGLGGTFVPDTSNTTSYSATGLGGWLSYQFTDGAPYMLHNGTASPIANGNSTYQPGQLSEQPGYSNEVAIVRWTAPSNGTFNVAATFSGLSSLGDSVDVHVLYDGTSLFNSTVNGHPAPASFSGLQSVLAGDTIDFVVGNGNGDPNEDNTALLAIITVPEPGALGLVGMGFGCLLSLRFLKRK